MNNRSRIFLFVGALLIAGGAVVWLARPVRNVASDGMSEGQRDKLALIESFQLTSDTESIVLATPYLEQVCLSAKEIDLVFAAREVAINGESPKIVHTFECARLAEGSRPGELRTGAADFRRMHRTRSTDTVSGRMEARLLFSGEEFPMKWRLLEFEVRGASSFTISEHELQEIRGDAFDFEL